MYVICRTKDPRSLRKRVDGLPVVFDDEDSAWEWINERPEMKKNWHPRLVSSQDWANGRVRNTIKKAATGWGGGDAKEDSGPTTGEGTATG